MDASSVREYKTQGTHEYVLVKAGLVRTGQDDIPQGTDMLNSCFSGLPVWDAVRPALLDMVKAQANEDSGFLAPVELRNAAVRTLRSHGLTENGRIKLLEAIRNAAGAVREEIAAAHLKQF